jgi:hypothetical protein
MNKPVLVVLLAVASNAAAAPVTSIYLGGGRPSDPDATGEESSLIVGGAVGLQRDRSPWVPRIAVDVRRISGPANGVDVDDLRMATEPRGLAVRALAGVRLRGDNARLAWFGQLSAGAQWERATSNLFFRPNAASPFEARGEKSVSDVGLVIEPALGAALRIGKLEIGVQLALAISQGKTVMPTSVNEVPAAPTNVLVTLFADHVW